MKRYMIFAVAAIQFILSGCGSVLMVEVSNPSDIDRDTELIEVSLDDIKSRLKIQDGESFILKDGAVEVPYQQTYDGKVVFPAQLKAQQVKSYRFCKGTPAEVVTKVCGDHYPKRVDDLCWENDLIGFRTYGFKEDAPSGYDIFTKRSTDLPVIPEFYRRAKDPKLTKIHKQLKKTDKRAADRFNWDSLSFHVDHGYGCDVYAVGPTLGAGTTALLDGEDIVYPFCYDKFEILDDGPLRFTIKLIFRPFDLGEKENIVETRIITLDLGRYFNKTEISFENLDSNPIVAGIVLQDKDGKETADAEKGYIAYPAPTMNFDKHQDVDNGIIFVASVFPEALTKAETVYFPDEESKARNNSTGHVLAYSEYESGKPFEYYWGAAWDHSNVKSYQEWISIVEKFSAQLRTPLIVKMK